MEKKYKLRYIALHITYVCENKCPYCYIGDERRESHPPLESVERVIEKLAHEGVKEALLLGGNPCTYPYLKEVVGLLKKSNFKISILSNTLEFSKDLDFFLKNIDDFQATILGANQKEHDAEARREGAYNILIKNTKLINGEGKGITVALTLHRNNTNILGMAENLIEKEKIQIKTLYIQRVIPRGRAEGVSEWSIKREQVSSIFEQLHKVQQKYKIGIYIEDPFPLCLVPEELRHIQQIGCQWGFTKGSVDFNGNLSRCGADNRFLLGNIFGMDSLQNFWEINPILETFRSRKWLPEECRNCKMLERCGGGCALSKATDKDHECDVLCQFC